MSINTTTKTRKGRRRIFSAVVAVVAAVALGIGLFSSLGTTTVYAADADASTVADWQKYANNKTENIGRIWTDKSVSTSDVSLTNTAGDETIRVPKTADADFLVGLSALSTASSLQTTTSQPLDIVLVLDVSGSMDNELYSYTAVYSQDLNTNRSYYIQDGNDWQEVEYSQQRREWGYSTGFGLWQEWHEATPKTSADDNASDHVQFYTRTSTSKIDALKSAVNGFIDSTAESNASLANDKKHRISIVKFAGTSRNTIGNNTYQDGWYTYNNTQVVSDFVEDVATLKNTVNQLSAAGATSADYGMNLTQQVLAGGNLGGNGDRVDGARVNAKQVVIFFTDGQPTYGNEFDSEVANDAIKAAGTMKSSGVTIYTVGVFEDADPTNTSGRFNGYMHGVSSNYPAAIAYDNLGTRAEDSDYYKAASDSDELASIFQDIFDESSASSGAPTQVEEGFDAHNSGYITFTDQLGSYMEVDDVNGVVFAGTLYEKITTETDSDGTVHYIFNQVVDNNEIYPNGTLADLIITVAKSENLADPDTVTVQIPASLIPVRYYDMDIQDGVSTGASITDAYPIRVFYSVSIKDEVTTALQEGATNADYDGLLTYMEENKDAAGTAAYFYSNDFTKDAERGNTTVDFTPASGNSFYFFTEDTPLYIDDTGTNRATGTLRTDQMYYYPKTVYTIADGTATSEVRYVEVPGENVVAAQNWGTVGVKQDAEGNWYVVTGTQKITRTEVEQAKDANTTGTASKVIEPEWIDGNIRVYLGNNGRLAVDIPGSLSVTKTVVADEGFTLPSGYENQEFEFTLALNLPQGAADEYTAEIKNADGTASGDAFPIGDNGKFTLKHGQTLHVYGLPDGATYTVTETPVTGYKSAQTHTPAGENLTEQTIYAGLTASTNVTNTYTADPVTISGSEVFGVTKVFDGRDTTADDVFDFVLYASTRNPDSNAVPADTSLAITMPNETTPVTSDMEAFGDITFTKPGTYTYYVYEDASNEIPGVVYTQTYYIVTIEVTPVDGVLQATASYQVVEPQQEATRYTYNEDTGLVFENSYDAASTTVYLSGQKSLQGRDLNRGEFTFKLTAVSKDGTRYETADAVPGDFPLPTTSAGEQTVGATTTNGQYAASGSPVNNIYFGSLTFDAAHIGHTYTYEIQEVVPADADMLGGVTYDTTTKTVTIEVTEDTTGDEPVVKATVKGTDGVELNTYPYYIFSNEYEPAPVTITGNTAVTVQKTLTGRDWLDNETYEFTIANTQSPVGVTAPMPADESIEIGKPAQGAVNTGAFADMTFDQAGTYVYSITETSADKDGVEMDRHTATVTVEVTDNLNGQLEADVTYDNSAASTDADKAESVLAAFTNVYSATGSTAEDDLNVTKILTGRTWLPTDEFEFTLQIDEDHADTVAALDEGSIVLPQTTSLKIGTYTEKTRSFGNITFTKPGEYHFIIKETVPTEGAIPGITYDSAERKVIINVTDVDHNGQLTVTKSDQSDDLTFENVYEAQPTDLNGNTYLEVIKNFTGRPDDEWLEDDAFTFTLAGGNEATLAAIEAGDIVMPADLEITIDNTDDPKEKAFANITFKKAGNYVFTVTEQASGIAGVTDDSKPVRTLNVSVVDNLNGTMTATVTAESDNLIFNNNYEPASGTLTGADNLEVTKNFTGRADDAWLESDSFTFTLAANDDATKAAVENDTVVLPDNADGIKIDGKDEEKTAAFGDITFKAAGTYEFVITELDTDKIPGVTYDSDLDRIIKVQVTDNKSGKLVASVAAGSDNLTFNNTYATGDGTLDGATALNIEKTLTGRDAWTDHDVFTFTLTGSEDAPMPDETTVVLTKDNVADGMTAAGSFGDITYTMDNRGKTYTYTITEQAGTVYGMTYSKAEYTVTVEVEDNGQGGLDVTSTMTQTKAADGSEMEEPADAAAFENSYKVPDNTKTVEKIDGDVKTDVNGQLVGVGDELTYTIHWVNDAIDETNGNPAEATVVITDQVPAGTEFVSAENDGVYADGTVTWTIEAAAAAEGDVSFTVKVTEDAVTVDQVTNTASVQVGTNDPKYTNEVTVDVPEKSVEDNTPDTGVQVGDELTYTIEYANTTDEAVDIVIRDTLHEGLTFKSADNDGTHENGVVTWTLKAVQPGTKGTVSVTAIVNEKALGEEIDNKATIQVGDDPEIDTSTVTTETKTGDLKISKMVTVDETQGTTIDTNKEFTFDVTLKNAAGENLTETYSFTGTTDGETAYDGEIANGNGRITLKHNGSITIEGLPEGATYTVTEAEAGSGYTQVTPAENAAATGTIAADQAAEAAFVNAYDAAEATGVPAGFTLTKVLEGKSWDGDAFSFVLTGVDGAPMPAADEANGIVVNEDGTVTKTVSAATGKDGDNDIAAFDFGEIKYSKAGTYTYTVTEVKGDNPGIAYDDHTATITVVVTDIQDGSATGQLVATATVTNGTFTNNYDTGSVDYDARGGIKVTKNMADRRITADEFEFVMTAKDDASAEKLGAESKSVKTAAADLKQTEDGSYVATTTMDLVTGMTFTKADVDKTYTYEVKETNGGSTIDGVTFDSKVYEVKIEVLDTDKQGVLTVNTYVDSELKATWTAARTRAAGDPVELVFNNSYDAGTISVGGEGDVKINATKTLVNDELQDGQFTFKVTDIKGNEVASGKNDAAGTIDFSEIKYTTESLNRDAETGVATRDTAGETDVYTYQYTVSEVTDNLADQGITATNASFSIKVKVTDDRKGSLTAEVIYPDGSDNGLAFQNVYGQGETVDLVLKGQKVLESAEGLKVPDITGKYTFTLEGLEGAPMPESNTATNDQAGNVTFGTITYKMEEVFGNAATTTADDVEAATDDSGIETYTAGRTKTYTYTVTESGTVAGVTNENAVKTIEVTVTDLGGGKLSAGVTSVSEGTPDGMNFKFTNTYSVDPTDSNPTVDTDLTFQKILDVQSGTKELQADEFTFELYAMAEDAGTAPVMTGTNDADGKIQMSPAITFTKPGTYDYRLVEVIPEDAVLVDGYYELNGITYLGYEYNLTATVTDNSDGTMTVTWKMYNSDGEDIEEVQTAEFVNMYSVSETDVTFSAGKTLTGRDLKAGEFTFEVKDEDGNVVDTATNDENGIVQFGTMTFGNVCERTFYVSEVKGDDKTITYDDTVYTVSVKVTDDGLGHLIAETAYDGDNMVFKNTYTKPAEPEKPDDTGAVKTGDSSTILPVIIALAAALIAIAAVVVIMIRRRRR